MQKITQLNSSWKQPELRFSCYPLTPIKPTLLESVKDGCLFYPCSGADMLTPIELFSPFITDFVFVDFGYFTYQHQDTRHARLDLTPPKSQPLLLRHPGYIWEYSVFDGVLGRKSIYGTPPIHLIEIYTHRSSGRTIRVHRRRDQGLLAIADLPVPISVFFYRGDSWGEGGSGDLWLSAKYFNVVLYAMQNHGLVVTDGRNKAEYGDIYHRLSMTCSFSGDNGHKLKFCQTCDLERSTWVWQVKSSYPSVNGLRQDVENEKLVGRDHPASVLLSQMIDRHSYYGVMRTKGERPRHKSPRKFMPWMHAGCDWECLEDSSSVCP